MVAVVRADIVVLFFLFGVMAVRETVVVLAVRAVVVLRDVMRAPVLRDGAVVVLRAVVVRDVTVVSWVLRGLAAVCVMFVLGVLRVVAFSLRTAALTRPTLTR